MFNRASWVSKVRSRVVAIACSAVMIGAAVSAIGSTAQADPEASRAESTVVQPGTLPGGPRPRVLYQQRRTIHDGDRTVRIRGPKRLHLVGKGRGGYVLVRYGNYHGHLWRIRPGHKAKRVGTVPDAGYNGGGETYGISMRGNRIAYAVPDRAGGDHLYVRALPSGKSVRERWLTSSFTSILAYPGSRMVLASGGTRWYSPKTNERRKISDDTALAVDVDDNVMTVRGGTDSDRFSVVAFDDPDQELSGWRRGVPLLLSPDGRYVLTRLGDGRTLKIRRTTTGKVVRSFKAALTITGSARWESNRQVVMTVRGSKVAAVVRCNVNGECERASRTVRGLGRLNFDWPLARAEH